MGGDFRETLDSQRRPIFIEIAEDLRKLAEVNPDLARYEAARKRIGDPDGPVYVTEPVFVYETVAR